jgi:hypothetical protein
MRIVQEGEEVGGRSVDFRKVPFRVGRRRSLTRQFYRWYARAARLDGWATDQAFSSRRNCRSRFILFSSGLNTASSLRFRNCRDGRWMPRPAKT